MSTLKILEYPHKGLRMVTAPITTFDDELRKTIKMMFDMMYQDDGCGLAATQLGLPLRLFVTDCSNDKSQPICMINPQIVQKDGEGQSDEGCLSFPGVYTSITRATDVVVNYQDEFGKPQTLHAGGLLAFCIQHELEHLDGILFIDHLSKLKRDRLLKKMEKIQRMAG